MEIQVSIFRYRCTLFLLIFLYALDDVLKCSALFLKGLWPHFINALSKSFTSSENKVTVRRCKCGSVAKITWEIDIDVKNNPKKNLAFCILSISLLLLRNLITRILTSSSILEKMFCNPLDEAQRHMEKSAHFCFFFASISVCTAKTQNKATKNVKLIQGFGL